MESELISSGINQTLHRMYLQVNCNVNLLTPFHTIGENISNQILIAEAIIVGTTPDTYYNFNGVTKEDTLNVLE